MSPVLQIKKKKKILNQVETKLFIKFTQINYVSKKGKWSLSLMVNSKYKIKCAVRFVHFKFHIIKYKKIKPLLLSAVL